MPDNINNRGFRRGYVILTSSEDFPTPLRTTLGVALLKESAVVTISEDEVFGVGIELKTARLPVLI